MSDVLEVGTFIHVLMYKELIDAVVFVDKSYSISMPSEVPDEAQSMPANRVCVHFG